MRHCVCSSFADHQRSTDNKQLVIGSHVFFLFLFFFPHRFLFMYTFVCFNCHKRRWTRNEWINGARKHSRQQKILSEPLGEFGIKSMCISSFVLIVSYWVYFLILNPGCRIELSACLQSYTSNRTQFSPFLFLIFSKWNFASYEARSFSLPQFSLQNEGKNILIATPFFHHNGRRMLNCHLGYTMSYLNIISPVVKTA